MATNLIQHIEIRSSRAGEPKAYIAGSRISVEDIYVRHELRGEAPDQIVAALPHLTLAQVHAALAYFYDHPEEIRRQLQEGEAFVALLKAQTGPGPLERKLKGMGADNASLPSG
jgi:uncharacterized protein (DUF433 family)